MSDEIERRLEGVIDRVPGGIEVRPLIASAIQIAVASVLEGLLSRRHNRPAVKSGLLPKMPTSRHESSLTLAIIYTPLVPERSADTTPVADSL